MFGPYPEASWLKPRRLALGVLEDCADLEVSVVEWSAACRRAGRAVPDKRECDATALSEYKADRSIESVEFAHGDTGKNKPAHSSNEGDGKAPEIKRCPNSPVSREDGKEEKARSVESDHEGISKVKKTRAQDKAGNKAKAQAVPHDLVVENFVRLPTSAGLTLKAQAP